MSDELVRVRDLKKIFSVPAGELHAVDGVDFSIARGSTIGIVGESGCGKSTLGRGVCKLENLTSGHVYLDGEDITEYNDRRMRSIRKKVQMVFQDPYASLNPHEKVYDIIAEGIQIHKLAKNREEEGKMVYELLEMVGLNAEHAARNVHEFSGGQRQRIGIARALSVNPEFLFCDEPISALDVSIQAQIVNLLMKLQKERNLTMLFIAHDLSVVKYISDRIGVMYLGKIVELADSSNLYMSPKHPYTRALLSAVPIADPDVSAKKEHIMLKGDVPSAVNPPTGCRFAGRCKECMEICRKVEPHMTEIETGHYVACHLYD